MNFLAWFHRYYRWDVIWILTLPIQFGAIEIIGQYRNESTVTDLIRALLPTTPWVRMLVVGSILLALAGVLFWHFSVQKGNYQ